MKKINCSLLLLPAVLLVFVLTTCKKTSDPEPQDEPQSFTELEVNENFRFQTTESCDLSVAINDDATGLPHKISVYTADPADGGSLLAGMMTGDDMTYTGQLKLPCRLETIYVQETSANGITRGAQVDKSAGGFSHEFGSAAKSAFKQTRDDPGCEDCDVLLTGNDLALIQPGNRYCVEEGATWNGQVKFYNGGELVVCGSADIYLNPSSSGGTLFISQTGEAVMDDLYLRYSLKLENYGNLEITGVTSVAFEGRLENYGLIDCQMMTNYANSTGLLNEGTINPSSYLNNLGELINNGTINTGSYFSNNSSADLQNNCRIIVTDHFNQVGTLHIATGAYLEVGSVFDSWSGSSTQLCDQGMIRTTDLEVEGTIAGPADGCGRLEVLDETEIKSGGNLTGFLDLCDENGIEINNGTTGPDVMSCVCFIPVTDCNPVGAGTPPIPDADGDGVPDDQDEYPDDAWRAFNSYYPNETDYGTMAFEDLWPALGDYDFNDLVMEFQYQMVTNADNDYVDLIGRFHIKAVGASKDNGFGIVLDVPPAETESVTGTVISGNAVTYDPKGFESGHSAQTVVMAYDAIVSMAEWSMINTVHGGNTLEFEPVEVTIYFNTPQESIGEPPYNPFIFIGQDREKELHMIDHEPTELAGMQYFGTHADASNPATGDYYKTSGFLPWVIEIPVSFDYPVEKTDIIQAHLKFAEWATSGGTLYTDWYMDLPDYRNPDNIY